MVETSRRREIEDAASSLFRTHGYAGTSVRDIARALDIQGASLYAHVTSKQDVLWSIVERMATRFEAAADAASSGAGASPVVGPGSRLAALVRGHIGVVTDDLERASVFVHEWRSLEGDRRLEIARRRDAYEERFRSTIRDGIATGTFAPVDPVPTVAFLLTAMNGLVSWYRADGRIAPAALADAYADLALRSVLALDADADSSPMTTAVDGDDASAGEAMRP